MGHPADNASGAAIDEALVELKVDECMRLLRTHHFGRLAFASAGWPQVVPVNYVCDGRSVVIRTAPGGKLDAAPMRPVAFEIDDAAPDGKWGWSVVLRGLAFHVSDSIDPYSVSNREQPVDPWAPGPKPNWLRVSATHVTGRRFGNPPP